MPKLEIEYTDEQMKAMEWQVINPLEWIQHAWDNKARLCVDRLVEEYSDYKAAKIAMPQKIEIVRGANIRTAAQRQKELEERMKG